MFNLLDGQIPKFFDDKIGSERNLRGVHVFADIEKEYHLGNGENDNRSDAGLTEIFLDLTENRGVDRCEFPIC